MKIPKRNINMEAELVGGTVVIRIKGITLPQSDGDTVPKATTDSEAIQRIGKRYSDKIHSARLTDTSKAKIAKRLTEFTEAEINSAIDRFAADPWWMENNGHRGMKWFFHSEERVEQFINLRSTVKPKEAVVPIWERQGL